MGFGKELGFEEFQEVGRDTHGGESAVVVNGLHGEFGSQVGKEEDAQVGAVLGGGVSEW